MTTPAKNDADTAAGCVVALALLAALFFLLVPGREHEGSIKTSDCREKISVEEGSSSTLFKKFTCTYQKSNSGNQIGGFCQAVEMNDGGLCQTVYSYHKKDVKYCFDPKLPYLGYDDRCYADPPATSP